MPQTVQKVLVTLLICSIAGCVNKSALPPGSGEVQPVGVDKDELSQLVSIPEEAQAAGNRAGVPNTPPPSMAKRMSTLGYAPMAEAERFSVPPHNTETYDSIDENGFCTVENSPLSTFSIDVDTASYANVRRFLRQQRMPPAGAVRIEEMINYFDYDYPAPDGPHPFSITAEVADAPWRPQHRLARIGLKGREVPPSQRPASNLVFLLDVSGSMEQQNKLPLLKSAMKLLVDNLNGNDRISIVVYAGAAGLVLPSTYADDRSSVHQAIASLSAGGSTAGGAGIELAYRTARANFITGGINRVILATDGDFNVGATSQSELVRQIEREAKSGVFLTVLGFGMGNYKGATLEKLADKGNGNYAYIDTLDEARKVLVDEAGSTLITIAKDVKIQVEFNPAEVAAYRLIGYENRLLDAQDFNDDTKDAGEIGAGHTVTALYELVPHGVELNLPGVDPLKYQAPTRRSDAAANGELFTVKVRYKQPQGDVSELTQLAVTDGGRGLSASSDDFRFAAAVAAFGMHLRGSAQLGDFDTVAIRRLADSARGVDRHAHRRAFAELVAGAERVLAQAD